MSASAHVPPRLEHKRRLASGRARLALEQKIFVHLRTGARSKQSSLAAATAAGCPCVVRSRWHPNQLAHLPAPDQVKGGLAAPHGKRDEGSEPYVQVVCDSHNLQLKNQIVTRSCSSKGRGIWEISRLVVLKGVFHPPPDGEVLDERQRELPLPSELHGSVERGRAAGGRASEALRWRDNDVDARRGP